MLKKSFIYIAIFLGGLIFGIAGSSNSNSPDVKGISVQTPTNEVEQAQATPTPSPTVTPTPQPTPTQTVVVTPTPIITPIPTTQTNSTYVAPVAAPVQKSSGGGYSCNCSKTCGQMSSCEEAYYQLNTCGCSKRDGNNDGVPCEDICK